MLSLVNWRQPWRLEWTRVAQRYLPFADAASAELPLSQLIRLALFQVSVGMVMVLTVGTLNRVMIVEIGVGAWLVSLMVALPLLVAPFRAVIGLKSDQHRSPLGWRRVPYIWIGSGLQFAGLAIMPFAIVLLGGETQVQLWAGHSAAALAFLLAGGGAQIVQTAGLALATDRATAATRPRVVALMYVMLLVGMVGASIAYSIALADFSETRLVQVIQSAAVITVFLNIVAVWKQEPRNPARNRDRKPDAPGFRDTWRAFIAQPRAKRFLWTVGLGTMAFNMQDIVLEPYGAEVLGLSVGATSGLTAVAAVGALAAFALAARMLARGGDALRVAAYGALLGLPAFAAVVFSAPLESPLLFRTGTLLIGFGGGMFAVGTLCAAMSMERAEHVGLALGAWGAVQATCFGVAIALGGAIRDIVSHLAVSGALGEALMDPSIGYSFVWHVEIYLLFATLIAIGPLVRPVDQFRRPAPVKFGLAGLPG